MVKTIKHIDSIPYFGNEKLLEVAKTKTFSEMVFELLSGKKPTKNKLKLFDLILSISIDHGTDSPSAKETIKIAEEKETISNAIAGGISKIDNVHGGAIEPAMELFYKIEKEGLNTDTVVNEYMEKNLKMPGFGHRIYEEDPRTKLIFEIANEYNIDIKFILIAQNISRELSNIKNKKIPVNIDGAIAAILCSFGWNSNLGKAVFITSRTPGLCGQYLNAISKIQP